jgi:hypothetical protein
LIDFVVMTCMKQGYSSSIHAWGYDQFGTTFLLPFLQKRVHLRPFAKLRKTTDGRKTLRQDTELGM